MMGPQHDPNFRQKMAQAAMGALSGGADMGMKTMGRGQNMLRAFEGLMPSGGGATPQAAPAGPQGRAAALQGLMERLQQAMGRRPLSGGM